MYDSANIAEKINNLLKEKNLSQKDMLQKCDLSKNTISSMLSRGSMPRADNLAKIADFLNCSIDDLMGRNIDNHLGESVNSEIISKFNTLSKENQEEIIHIINYKYELLLKKRKENLSLSGFNQLDESLSKFA